MFMKRILLLLLITSISISPLSAASVQDNVLKVQWASTYSAPSTYEPKWFVGSIISQIFDSVGKVLSDYVLAFRNILTIDNTVPVWNASTKVFDVGTITDTGTNVWIWVTSPWEKLTVSGRLSITGNPNSDDDVWDRGYNDVRYINVWESWDAIQNGTIDSSEIENNTLSSADLAANSVGNSELNNSEVFSMAGLNLNGKAKMIQSGSYDLWIQWGNTDTGGNNRNLAFLWQKSNDQLRINYGWEYTWGTRFDGNVGIGTSPSGSVKLDVNGKIRMQWGTSSSDGTNVVATKWYVDAAVSGAWLWEWQSWQVVTRVRDTWYQNTTGKPIMVFHKNIYDWTNVRVGSSTSNYVNLDFRDFDSDLDNGSTFIVPTWHYYRFLTLTENSANTHRVVRELR
jgi:hypothetical protein